MKRLVVFVVLVALAVFPAGAAASKLKIFHTPDGNIGCAMLLEKGGGSVRCDIGRHHWQAPPKPSWCDVDWGNGLQVGEKRATFVCAGDTILHQGSVLAVGSSARLGAFRCKVLPGAVRCVNRRTGHGFVLSPRRAKRF